MYVHSTIAISCVCVCVCVGGGGNVRTYTTCSVWGEGSRVDLCVCVCSHLLHCFLSICSAIVNKCFLSTAFTSKVGRVAMVTTQQSLKSSLLLY